MEQLKRGTLVTVAIQGDYGKPRPALVIQSDMFEDHGSVTLLLVTSDIVDAPALRVSIPADVTNGLSKTSQIMIDKLMTVPKSKVGKKIGVIDRETLTKIERNLLLFLGFA